MRRSRRAGGRGGWRSCGSGRGRRVGCRGWRRCRGGGGEVDVDGLAGDGVLLEAHLGDGEAVDDVLGVEAEVDLAVGGED
jgi:hypothetical protein